MMKTLGREIVDQLDLIQRIIAYEKEVGMTHKERNTVRRLVEIILWRVSAAAGGIDLALSRAKESDTKNQDSPGDMPF